MKFCDHNSQCLGDFAPMCNGSGVATCCVTPQISVLPWPLPPPSLPVMGFCACPKECPFTPGNILKENYINTKHN